MDRRSPLKEFSNVVVQRRHAYDLASLTLTAHYAQLVLNPTPTTGAAVAANHYESKVSKGLEPRVSTFAAGSGDTITFPVHLIGRVTRLPSVPARSDKAAALFSSGRAFPVWVQLKDFESLTLFFADEQTSRTVFVSLRSCAVLQSIEQLAAFYPDELSSLPRPAVDTPLDTQAGQSGWSIYDAKKEFERQGVWSRTKAWRTTTLNAHHAFCPTYPSLLVVPSRISDATLQHGAKFRSKSRLPALTYLHWAHLGSITRSSQPLVGLRYSRSVQDEKLVDAIFTSHLFAGEAATPQTGLRSSEEGHTADSSLGAFDAIDSSEAPTTLGNHSIYGAKSGNVIIDARPTTNAYANHAKGAGSETMDYYPGCTKVFLGIDNIHVMRDSLKAITEALADADVAPGFGSEGQDVLPPLDPSQIKRSGWLKHITTLLEGAGKIVRSVHVDRAHVLIHCSDGWDRTSQLSALAQVCLDPYYRTFQGFAVLVEKDFVSFGHRFLDRTGHLSHGNFFEDKFQSSPDSESDAEARNGGFEPATAASALWGFTKSVAANLRGPQDQESVTHLKEISPVFHQFLDCVYQLHRQFPERFEFATGWLVELQRALHACTTGIFLFNTEVERVQFRRRFPGIKSLWDDLLSPAAKDYFRNPSYDPELEATVGRTDVAVLIPDGKDVRLWPALFRRSDRDLNSFIDAERSAQAQIAAERDARRKRLEQRLEAAAQGRSVSPSGETGEGISLKDSTTPDGYAGLAYRPYQAKSRSVPRKQPTGTSTASHRALEPRDMGLPAPSASDEQLWDPAAVGKRQVQALWSAGKGWLFGGDQAGSGEEGNSWGTSSPMGVASTSSTPLPAVALHGRNDSMSSWDANVWSEPASDPLSTDMQRLAVSASSLPSMAPSSSNRSTGPAAGAPVYPQGLLDPWASSTGLSPKRVPRANSPDSLRAPPARHPDQARAGSRGDPLGPLAGDPLGASWASSNGSGTHVALSGRTSATPALPPDSDWDGKPAQPVQPVPTPEVPSGRAGQETLLAQLTGGHEATISARAQVSSDPLGVL